MVAELLTVADALRGLYHSIRAIRRELDNFSDRIEEARPATEAIIEELIPIETSLAVLNSSLEAKGCTDNVSIEDICLVLVGCMVKLSQLESFTEDLLAASDRHARPFARIVLNGCTAKLHANAATLQTFKMAILLMLQLINAPSDGPKPILERRQASFQLRVQDIKSFDVGLQARVAKYLERENEASEPTRKPPSARSKKPVSRLLSVSSVANYISEKKRRGGWRTLLCLKPYAEETLDEKRSQRDESATRQHQARPIQRPRTAPGSAGNYAGTADTVAKMKLPVSADELANGHHYLLRASLTASFLAHPNKLDLKRVDTGSSSLSDLSRFLPSVRRFPPTDLLNSAMMIDSWTSALRTGHT